MVSGLLEVEPETTLRLRLVARGKEPLFRGKHGIDGGDIVIKLKIA